MQQFAVECPKPYNADHYINVGWFDTRQEAVNYAMEVFGADEDGNICLVSGPHGKDEDESSNCRN